MNVLIAQTDADLALSLAEQVARAGGRVTGIVTGADAAFAVMGRDRTADIIFLDAALSEEADHADPTFRQRTKGKVWLCGSFGESQPGQWPVLKDQGGIDEIRLVLMAARHFGRKRAALH